MNANQVVQFNNQEIPVFFHNNKPYVAMKPICENIGLAWHGQFERIKRDDVLSSTMCVIHMVAQDGKKREVVALPIGYLNGWLFGIDVNRVKPEIKSTLIKYKLECYDVLYNHFMPKVAEVHPNTITTEQQQAIKDAVLRKAQRDKRTYQSIYHEFYNAFDIPRYQELPLAKFNEALKWLGDGWYQNKQPNETRSQYFESHAINAASHMLWVNAWWKCFGGSIQMLNPTMASMINDHFADGAFCAGLVLGRNQAQKINESILLRLPYDLDPRDRISFFRQR